jgi:predicted DNA-binding transcriptional regulator AlpA
MTRLLTIKEVAERYPFIPEATWRYWRHRNEGPPSARIGGRRVVFKEDQVEAWIEAQFAAEHGVA